jgi:hypothetical protein
MKLSGDPVSCLDNRSFARADDESRAVIMEIRPYDTMRE